MHPVRIGCSGWNYKDWRPGFYPEGLPASRWLASYAERFDTVEVNNTFYRLPNREAVARWAKATPPGFCFAVKASRYLTHVKRLTDLGQGLARFYERIEPLTQAGKLGPVLWQLPPNFRRDDVRLRRTLAALPPGRHAFEFRDASWFDPEVLSALREHGAALVIGDHPERPFQLHEATADWLFIRMHYGRRGRVGNYSRAELERWAELIRTWRERHEILVYFNNDWQGFAPRNAAALAHMLER